MIQQSQYFPSKARNLRSRLFFSTGGKGSVSSTTLAARVEEGKKAQKRGIQLESTSDTEHFNQGYDLDPGAVFTRVEIACQQGNE